MDAATPEAPPARKTWTAGTLVYTSGGLAGLFVLLLLGDFAWSMRDRSVGQMAQWYLSELKVPSLLFAVLVSSLPAVIGLILGPVISVRSDRHRGRWGRRIPYLLVTTPLAVFGMLGLGLSPLIARGVHFALSEGQPAGAWLRGAIGGSAPGAWFIAQTQNEIVVSVICFAVFWTAFEVATIAGQAVFGGLINDVVPAPLLGRFYGLFRAISLIDGMIFNQLIFGHVTSYYTLILCAIGILYGTCFMAVCLMVREGEYPPPEPAASGGRVLTRGWGEVRRYLRECFSHRYYVLVFCLLMFAHLTFLPVNTFNMPFSRSLDIDPQRYGHFYFLTYLISLCLAFPLGWLVDKVHPLRVVIGSLVAYVCVTFWGAFFISSPTVFLYTVMAHGVISGCYWTSAASLPNRLFPASRFAQFASAAGILGSVAGIVMAPTLGLIIDASGKAYRFAYLGGFLIALTALFFAWRVYGRFMALGGPANYQAPDPDLGLEPCCKKV